MRILEATRKANAGVAYYNQKNIDEVNEEMGVARERDLEAQVHYSAVTFRKTFEDASFIDINVPILYFNYKQTVTSASIEFDLKDVQEINIALIDVIQQKADQCLKENSFLVEEGFEPMITNYHTLHSHPGGSHQGFSGTDLCDDIKNPGIVFPFLSTEENTPSFSGILYRPNNGLKLAHQEYRVVSTKKDDIQYVEEDCYHYVDETNEPTKAMVALGASAVDGVITNIDNEWLFDIVSEIEFDADTDFCSGDNVTQANNFNKFKNNKSSHNKWNNYYIHGEDDFEEDDGIHQGQSTLQDYLEKQGSIDYEN